MTINQTQVFGFETAIRAMRNPLDSWDKSDSFIVGSSKSYIGSICYQDNIEKFALGEADAKLSQKLTKAGDSHSKHLRFIRVWADIIAPRFWWQEMDTYKHVDKISCSTMHTLMKEPVGSWNFELNTIPAELIDKINNYIKLYQATDDPEEKHIYLLACKNTLPEGFLQKRTISTNYQCLLNIYHQRKNHRLPMWHQFCSWILKLPYFIELTGVGDKP